MHKVIINGKTVYVNNGTLLSDVLNTSDKSVIHICGGKGICKKCLVTVNGKDELSCQYKIQSDITVTVKNEGAILSETGAQVTDIITENLCFALDIGTTTLALAVVSPSAEKIIKVITRNNPQRIFGADVIARIDYCRKNGEKELQDVIISEVNSMIEESGLTAEKLFVSGNTTMLHLFFGVDCSSIGVAPYTPVFLESKNSAAETLGIIGVKTIISLPSIASFVGADLVAGLEFVGMPRNGKHNLLVDLGTNAEIVLYSQNSALCTSAAAGPCFEGANISCGMSAVAGAVYSYSENGYKTVSDAPVKGICGTGLVDIVAYLVDNGIVDETGYMENPFDVAEGVSLSPSDIRQYQLAKSAVYSAIMTLIEMKNVSYDDIEKLYISGGFSAKINIENAVKTGLLPEELKDKCKAINNSSLLGTVKYACEEKDLSVYVDNSDYVDLSLNPLFSDLFIKNMMFDQK
ncbi:MAG: DUF4445 domain-containing protein [Clostridia bacterium]|nr:DUF4445 domain-containing protein [Clostridia bacterium]